MTVHQFQTALGCTVTVDDASTIGPSPGVLVMLDMNQDGDRRHAEVFLANGDVNLLRSAVSDVPWSDKPTTGHRISLGYTTEDDGIHINCECGADIPLGHNVSMPALAVAASQHWYQS